MAVVTAAVVTAGAAVAGTVASRNAQQDAQREQKRAANIEREKAAVQNARARRRASAEAQIAVSQRQAQAASQEGGTTGTETAIGAIGSQTASNINFQQQIAGLSQRGIAASTRANQDMARAQQAQQLGMLPSQLFGTTGQFIGMMGNTPSPSQFQSNATQGSIPTRNMFLQPGQFIS